MGRRAATVSQADIERFMRAARRQYGDALVFEMRPDGSIRALTPDAQKVELPPLGPEPEAEEKVIVF